jgi:membrane protease YdiL (CAAX protease family)
MASINTRTWLAVAPAMVLPCAASIFYFILFSDCAFAGPLYAATKAFTVVWPVIAVWFIFRTRLPRVDLRDAKHRKAIPLGILTGLAMALVMLAAMHTSLGEMVARNAGNVRNKARELGFLNYYCPLALFLSLVNSLIEEYYWRWFVFGHLRQVMVPAGAYLLGAAAFTSHHVVETTQFFPMPWGLFFGASVGLAGVIWSAMYRRQQTLVGAWVSHLLADLGIMYIGYGLLFCSAS